MRCDVVQARSPLLASVLATLAGAAVCAGLVFVALFEQGHTLIAGVSGFLIFFVGGGCASWHFAYRLWTFDPTLPVIRVRTHLLGRVIRTWQIDRDAIEGIEIGHSAEGDSFINMQLRNGKRHPLAQGGQHAMEALHARIKSALEASRIRAAERSAKLRG